MSSPLVPAVAVKAVYFNTYLNSESIRSDRIAVVQGDDVKMTFTVHNRKGEESDLTGFDATMAVAVRGASSPVATFMSGVSITISGSQVIVAFNASDLPTTGSFTYQLRITKDGKALTIAQGRLDVDILVE